MIEADVIARAEALLAEGRGEEALKLTGALVAAPEPSHLALASHSGALKLLGRPDEALPFDEQAIARFGQSPIAWHNYAGALEELGRAPEAVEACEQAFRLGIDASQTFAVYARALRGSGAHDRAEYAYNQAMMRSRGEVGTAQEFANFVWMRRGDLAFADKILDSAFHGGGRPAPLLMAKATLYEAAGEADRAQALLDAASRQFPAEVALLLDAAELALRRERPAEAEAYVRRAEAVQPASRAVVQLSAIVDLARGRPQAAFEKLKAGLARHPDDQSLWGWMATAARAIGDPLYRVLCDYEAVVGAYEIETPQGWPDLPAFLADLGAALKEMHLYQQHPTNQSLRHGSQTMHKLSGSQAPPMKAFFQAIEAPIREHMKKLGKGADPLRRRNTFDYRIAGAWSVRLRPGGFHRDHFHPEGWLSSAFYVETPDAALASQDRQGWIRFGQPPFVTEPPLPAEHYVRPLPGRLVLFPSYMWHGTVPFTTDEARMTIAFDAVPK